MLFSVVDILENEAKQNITDRKLMACGRQRKEDMEGEFSDCADGACMAQGYKSGNSSSYFNRGNLT